MKNQMEELLITKVAIPKISCEYKDFEWERVREIIEEVFRGTDIEILVCLI